MRLLLPALAFALPLAVLAGCDSHVQKARTASACYPLACDSGLSAPSADNRQKALSRQALGMARNLGGTAVSVAGRQMRMAQVTLEGHSFLVFQDGLSTAGYGAEPDRTAAVLSAATQLSPCGRADRVWRSRGQDGTGSDYIVALDC